MRRQARLLLARQGTGINPDPEAHPVHELKIRSKCRHFPRRSFLTVRALADQLLFYKTNRGDCGIGDLSQPDVLSNCDPERRNTGALDRQIKFFYGSTYRMLAQAMLLRAFLGAPAGTTQGARVR